MDMSKMPTFCFWFVSTRSQEVFLHLQWFHFYSATECIGKMFHFPRIWQLVPRQSRREQGDKLNSIRVFNWNIVSLVLWSRLQIVHRKTPCKLKEKKLETNEWSLDMRTTTFGRWWYPIHIIDLYRIYRYSFPRKGNGDTNFMLRNEMHHQLRHDCSSSCQRETCSFVFLFNVFLYDTDLILFLFSLMQLVVERWY